MTARLRSRSLPLLALALASACGSAPTPAPAPPPPSAHSVQTAPARPRPDVLVLSGSHAFAGATWLPSGMVVAHSAREVWLVSPKEPDRARFVGFDSDIESIDTNEHDDTVAVATADGKVSLVRDLHVVKTFPGELEWGQFAAQLSPDGKLVARTAPRIDEDSAQVQLLDVETGKTLLTMRNQGPITFDPTSHFASNHEAIYDVAGTQKFKLPDADLERVFYSQWVGPRLAYPERRVLRLVDPVTGKVKKIDIACKDAEVSATEIFHAGRFLRACGNRFMVVDGATGTLTRIKLPTSPANYAQQISPRGAGYVVSLPDDQQALVDVDAGKAHLEKGTWLRADDQPLAARRGDQWLETPSGALAIRNNSDNTLVAGWGGGLQDSADRPFAPSLGLRYRVRAGALEVTNRTNPMIHAEPFVHRFGTDVAAAPPVTPPSECQTSMFAGTHSLFSGIDLRSVVGRADAVCICLDTGCEVRPVESGWEVLAATPDYVLYLKGRDATGTTLVRVGKDGPKETKVDAYCLSAVIAADRRAFALCYPTNPKGKMRPRKGAGVQLVELGAVDLAVAGTREIPPEYPSQVLEAVGNELALTAASMNPAAYLFPQGNVGCTTECTKPAATVSTWTTFSILQRDGNVQVAGKAEDAARAVVCIDGDVATPWATCRK